MAVSNSFTELCEKLEGKLIIKSAEYRIEEVGVTEFQDEVLIVGSFK